MAWRFKASKYKNAAPIVPKFENLIRGVSIGSFVSNGNFISASAAYMTFNWDSNGSNLGVLPIETKGRQNQTQVPLIYAHSEFVTDFKFSPFDDGLLATGSQDATVKIWRIPEDGMPLGGISQPELTLPSQPRRIESVDFHPTADCVLATSSQCSLVIWDIVNERDFYSFNDHEDEVQSVAWQVSGQLLATQCKDRRLRIIDPRGDGCVSSCGSHQSIKDSKVVWLSDNTRVMTTGFSGDQFREITIRDIRRMDTPQKNMSLDMSSGILLPLYDPDTNMCFLCGKGDRNVQFVEISDKDPFILEGLKHSGDQTKGACLVPKRAMNVMEGEVNRVLQLCDSAIVPITWQVPRKSYREYHADIYPETRGYEPAMSSDNWWGGSNQLVAKISLDPRKRPKHSLTSFSSSISERKCSGFSNRGSIANGGLDSPGGPGTDSNGCHKEKDDMLQENMKKNLETTEANKPKPHEITNTPTSRKSFNDTGPTSVMENSSLGTKALTKPTEGKRRTKTISEFTEKDTDGDSTFLGRRRSLFDKNPTSDNNNPQFRRSTTNAPVRRPGSKVFGRISKFKHLKGEVVLKEKFENLKNLSRTVPAECNMIHANPMFVAVPLTGPGGKIAIFDTRRPGRIPAGVVPAVINGSTVMDFCFDPFDHSRLVAGCEDGFIRVWSVPEGGLHHQTNEPVFTFFAHVEKIQIVKFHPIAKDIFLTAAFDRSVKIWDLSDTEEAKIELQGHQDQLFSIEWSRNGRYVASVSRDGRIRIYEPRNSSLPTVEGGEIVPKKGARVLWVLDDQYLIVTGFGRQSEREVMFYQSSNLTEVYKVDLDVSPTILVPYYDEDSSTLFVTGKGESTVTTFEVAHDPPHLFPLTPYKPSGLHQGFSFLPKSVCKVRNVEFAKAYRLTNSTIEPISFTVPRVKTTFFQDDVFPPTKILWTPTLTGNAWLEGDQRQPLRISLKPDDMKALSE